MPANNDLAAAAMAEGDRFFWLDNWLKAREHFAEAERRFLARGDERNALYAKVSRLRADADRLGYPGISSYLSEQLASPLVQRDEKLRLRCLVIKAAIDLSIDPPSSATTWSDALKLAQALGEKGWAGRAQGELAVIAFLEGRTTDAQSLLAKSIAAAMYLGDVAGQVRGLSLAAVGLLELGEKVRALGYADQALSLAARTPDIRFPLMAHMAKAGALDALDRRSEAEQFLNRALAFVNESGMSVYRADVLIALGERAARARRREQAVRYFEDAIQSAVAVRMPRPRAAALFHLSRLFSETGDLARAEERVTEGLAASRELVDMYVLPQHLASAAEIKAKRGKSLEAASLYGEATDLVEAMLVNVPSPTLRTSLIAAMSRIYVGHFRLAIEQLKNSQMAFGIVERARGRVAADELRTRRFERTGTSVASKVERSITEIQIRLQRTTNSKERHALLQQLFIAEENLGPALLEQQRVKRFAESDPITIPQLRRVLGKDELFVEYVLSDPASFAICVSRTTFRVHRLPGDASIRALVERFRRDIESKKELDGSSAEQLRIAILGNIPEFDRYERLTIVPDGVLHLIPFDILTNAGARHVGDDHVVSYALSGTVLQILRVAGQRTPGAARLLAVGMADAHPTAGSPVSTPKVNVSRGMFDADGAGLPNLPGTAEEVADVAEMGGATATILRGRDATEAGFKSRVLTSFGILHLALHGVADRRFPERSALVFRPSQDSGEDGLLQVREVRSLRLSADLVTLSACETGAGRVDGQEGMGNLVRAFLFAGARNVAASLWEADDAFTVQLMKRFYSRIAAGQDVARAMQSAKNELRDAFGARSKPYYWGGFVVVGEGRSRPRLKAAAAPGL